MSLELLQPIVKDGFAAICSGQTDHQPVRALALVQQVGLRVGCWSSQWFETCRVKQHWVIDSAVITGKQLSNGALRIITGRLSCCDSTQRHHSLFFLAVRLDAMTVTIHMQSEH